MARKSDSLNFDALKEKQRSLRAGFSEPLTLRVHRALSWLGRAEQEIDDLDVRFVLLWIGFNAAYAGDVRVELTSERGAFKDYFETLVSLDTANRIYNSVWGRFPHEIRLLLQNKYVFAPFWQHYNGVAGYEDWESRLAASQKAIGSAMAAATRPECSR